MSSRSNQNNLDLLVGIKKIEKILKCEKKMNLTFILMSLSVSSNFTRKKCFINYLIEQSIQVVSPLLLEAGRRDTECLFQAIN